MLPNMATKTYNVMTAEEGSMSLGYADVHDLMDASDHGWAHIVSFVGIGAATLGSLLLPIVGDGGACKPVVFIGSAVGLTIPTMILYLGSEADAFGDMLKGFRFGLILYSLACVVAAIAALVIEDAPKTPSTTYSPSSIRPSIPTPPSALHSTGFPSTASQASTGYTPFDAPVSVPSAYPSFQDCPQSKTIVALLGTALLSLMVFPMYGSQYRLWDYLSDIGNDD